MIHQVGQLEDIQMQTGGQRLVFGQMLGVFYGERLAQDKLKTECQLSVSIVRTKGRLVVQINAADV